MASIQTAEYLMQAADLRRLAQCLSDKADRRAVLRTAREWERLASSVAGTAVNQRRPALPRNPH